MPIAESSLSILLCAALGMFAAAGAAAIPPLPPEAAGAAVMDDTRLRLICVAGSLGGAVLSVALFRLRTPREMAGKLVSSSVAGILFAPMLIRWLGWARDVDAVLAVSGVTALMSWTVLQSIVPMLAGSITKRVQIATGRE